jgi:hypothetical protein
LVALLIPFSFSQHRRSFLNFPLPAPFLPVLKNALVLRGQLLIFLSSKIVALFSFTTSRFLFNSPWHQLVSRVPPKKTQSLMSVCHLSGRGLGLELKLE